MPRNAPGCSCGFAPALLVLVAGLAGMASAHAHEEPVPVPGVGLPGRPALAGRIVRTFDFEERQTNPLPVPQYWFRSQNDPSGQSRPGFPPWNAAKLDYDLAHNGEGSVRLPISGGSASLRLEPGVIPVLPGADYMVSASLRTGGGSHARARVTARFLDAAGTPIQGSERSTAPRDTAGAWEPQAIQIRGNSPEAAFLQIDLEMLQPREWEKPPLPDFKVWPEDFNAAAWFDDVRVTQLPRVELQIESARPAVDGPQPSIVRSDTPPALRAHLRDLTGQSLVARLSVRDLAGTLLDSQVFEADRGPGGIRWSPRLSSRGWFEARMELFADGAFVGSATLPFGWLEPNPISGSDATRFLVGADSLDPATRDQFPALVVASGAGASVLPAWEPGLERASIDAGLLGTERSIDALLAAGVQVGLSLPVIPDELAALSQFDSRDTLRLIAEKGADAQPYIDPLIDHYGQSVQRWFFGSPFVGPMTGGQELADQLAKADGVIGQLVPGPILSIPWDGSIALPPELAGYAPDGMFVTSPEGVGPGGIAEWLDSIAQALADAPRRSNDPIELTLIPRLLEPQGFGRVESASHLAKQIVEAWSRVEALDNARIRLRIGLMDPWSVTDSTDPALAPTPALIAMAGMASHLADRRVVMRLPTAPGTYAYLLGPSARAQRARSGAIVAWSDGRDPGASLSLYLGPDRITVSDPFGNAVALPDFGSSDADRIRTHDVPLASTPSIIEGVDERIVALGASFRIEPSFIPAIHESHERTLVIGNPFGAPIDIRYFITKPGGDEDGRRDRAWSVTPRAGSIQIAPGQEGRIPITVVPSIVEEAGQKEFVLDAQVSADRPYGWIRMVANAELGLPGIRVDVNASPSPGPSGPDIVADVLIANTGTEPLTLEVAAFAPGFPRQRSAVNSVPPGASVVRRFVFPKSLAKLRNERIIISVIDTSTGGRLNTGVSIDPVP